VVSGVEYARHRGQISRLMSSAFAHRMTACIDEAEREREEEDPPTSTINELPDISRFI